MYGIFTNIYPIYFSNVGKYTIHGAYGLSSLLMCNSVPTATDQPDPFEALSCQAPRPEGLPDFLTTPDKAGGFRGKTGHRDFLMVVAVVAVVAWEKCGW